MSLELTTVDDIRIEAKSANYVRYRARSGRRWEVYGVCDKRGLCLVGGTVDGEFVETQERAQELARAYTGLDDPVTPEFKGCCPFEFVELPWVKPDTF